MCGGIHIATQNLLMCYFSMVVNGWYTH